MPRKQNEVKAIEERQFEEHSCFSKVGNVLKLLGIDKEKWYFGEATEILYHTISERALNVYYGNEEIEDITMSFDFRRHEDGEWKLEDFSMSLD